MSKIILLAMAFTVLQGEAVTAWESGRRYCYDPNKGAGGLSPAPWYNTTETDSLIETVSKEVATAKTAGVAEADLVTTGAIVVSHRKRKEEIEKAFSSSRLETTQKVKAISRDVMTQDLVKAKRNNKFHFFSSCPVLRLYCVIPLRQPAMVLNSQRSHFFT